MPPESLRFSCEDLGSIKPDLRDIYIHLWPNLCSKVLYPECSFCKFVLSSVHFLWNWYKNVFLEKLLLKIFEYLLLKSFSVWISIDLRWLCEVLQRLWEFCAVRSRMYFNCGPLSKLVIWWCSNFISQTFGDKNFSTLKVVLLKFLHFQIFLL